ncbi:MAG TPA: hypothetical protein VJR23_16015 [Candidatus Acidoferrales bacterium]|nr:hypothetical protein [Candidatus Acidoferrales bacterium]
MIALVSNAGMIAQLKTLNAGIAFAVSDFGPEHALAVRRLNEAGIPLVAWIELPADQGVYMNAGNAAQASERFDEFEKWTAQNQLQWAGVGLDIEPNFGSFRGGKWHILKMLVKGAVNGGRVERARVAYTALIRRIHSRGYSVQTYQLPLIATDRRVHSTMFERTLGVVDVRGDLEALMIYTSLARSSSSAPIWEFGPGAQAIVVGVTLGSGDPAIDAMAPPLDWDQFSSDLIVASHYSQVVGVYDLEGCVKQGFLRLLVNFDWNQKVTIPGAAIRKISLLSFVIRSIIWILSHLIYILLLAIILIAWFFWRRKKRAAASVPPELDPS